MKRATPRRRPRSRAARSVATRSRSSRGGPLLVLPARAKLAQRFGRGGLRTWRLRADLRRQAADGVVERREAFAVRDVEVYTALGHVLDHGRIVAQRSRVQSRGAERVADARVRTFIQEE